MRRPVIFIGGDHAIPDILDDVASELRARQCEVIRGRIEPPPKITEYSPGEWPALFGSAEIIMITVRTRAPRALLEAAPHLRGIVFPTIGTESVDLNDARDLGLVIGHGPTPENFTGMAESTVMLIAALFLDFVGKERLTRLNLPRPSQRSMKARLVRGKTIGLVGLGRIARSVVERLAGWDVRILAYDPYVAAADVPPGVQLVDFATLLRQSDLVSVHVTLSNETRNIIGATELAQMKSSAYLVNTSRGGAIDEAALVAALRSGRLAGAALDVFEKEPLPPDSPLRSLDNVILTSHIVGHAAEMHESFVRTAVENITRILRGEPPLYVRNPDVLPLWRSRLARLHESLAEMS
jgi:phosphoglycerate dehydrogenase-like enzyme